MVNTYKKNRCYVVIAGGSGAAGARLSYRTPHLNPGSVPTPAASGGACRSARREGRTFTPDLAARRLNPRTRNNVYSRQKLNTPLAWGVGLPPHPKRGAGGRPRMGSKANPNVLCTLILSCRTTTQCNSTVIIN